MVLAEKLAHLVRRANRSGVGRGAASAVARARRSAPACLASAVARVRGSAPAFVAGTFFLFMLCGGFLLGSGGTTLTVPHHRSAAASRHGHHRSAAVDALLADAGGNAVEELGATSDLQLPAATTAPAAAPASVADQPPLAARENFAFAPYWTLTQSPLFDLTGLSTLDYFAVGVNPNGSLDENGPGWDGFESQDLSDLITRAHEAGERVVLTVNDFDQGSLDTLTTSPTAATTLSSALIPLLQAKSLDGVNFDFEGDGSGDQVGLTSLIEAVSGALRAADPHWQVTMDTYASSAGDSDGFYNIPALAPFVDAFFVMDYELNLAGSPSGASPLTSGAFSSLTTLKQYTSVVPASKVILGLPFFGIDWPTNNGTMAANATGGANDIAESQAQGNGPEYWDPVTGTEWTSYQVGNQWHESYYEGEYGLYEADLMAAYFGARGVGIWALGMESDGAQLIAALDGISPGGPGSTGPAATSSSPGAAPAPAPAPAPATVSASAPASSPGSSPAAAAPAAGSGGSSNTPAAPAPAASSAPAAATTTTTVPTTTAVYDGATVVLTAIPSSQVATLTSDGTVSDFESNVPSYTCLNGATLDVYDNLLSGQQVAKAATPTNCITQDFQLPA